MGAILGNLRFAEKLIKLSENMDDESEEDWFILILFA